MEKAVEFIEELLNEYELTSSHLLIVPGNHDIEDTKPSFMERFAVFKEIIHSNFCSSDFPDDDRLSVDPKLYTEDKIQFLLLNSCWEIRDYERLKISINSDARIELFDKADTQVEEAVNCGQLETDRILRVALFHHPVKGFRETGNRSIANGGDLCKSLVGNGIQLCLHGDIHDLTRDEVFQQSHSGQDILFIAGTGSFAAPREDLSKAVGDMYSVLEIARNLSIIKVNVRWKRNANSSFDEYPEWPIPGMNRGKVGHYYINIKEKRVH
jgi:Calcineurin-like phosphoesterase